VHLYFRLAVFSVFLKELYKHSRGKEAYPCRYFLYCDGKSYLKQATGSNGNVTGVKFAKTVSLNNLRTHYPTLLKLVTHIHPGF